jgi:hypothetical protein
MVQFQSLFYNNLIMTRVVQSKKREVAERESLRKRVKQFYVRFNQADWEGCYALIDPQLANQGKVNFETYSESMQAFKEVYGSLNPWMTRLSLHLDGAPKQRDDRPFGYVYLIWQDAVHGFHMFRERWIKDDGHWFTRVVGLVPNRQKADLRGD